MKSSKGKPNFAALLSVEKPEEESDGATRSEVEDQQKRVCDEILSAVTGGDGAKLCRALSSFIELENAKLDADEDSKEEPEEEEEPGADEEE